MKTTLNKIRKHGPCSEGWTKLLSHLGKTQADDEPLSLVTILNSNGLDDAIWCLRSVEGYDREIRLYAVDCARDVQHLMTDERSIKALDVAERFAHGVATEYELKGARSAAFAVWAAWDAARDAAWAISRGAPRSAARAAWSAADAAAWDAAWGAWDAAWSAARASWAISRGAPRSAADAVAASAAASAASARAAASAASARAAIKAKQEQRFREMVAKAEKQS